MADILQPVNQEVQNNTDENSKTTDKKIEELGRQITSLQQQHITESMENKKAIKDLSEAIIPLVEIFTSVKSFNGVAWWILKFLGGLGAAITAGYVVLDALRKLLIPK